MDTITPKFTKIGSADPANDTSSQLSRQWTALQDAAQAVALLAGLAPEEPSSKIRNFPALIKNVKGWRLELAKNQIADISAMMQPGVAALLAVNARGQDATAAALTLWREFYAAREAVLSLLPETGSMGPRRSA